MSIHVVLDARTLDDHFPGIGRYTFHLAQALTAREDIRLTLIVNPRARDSRFPRPQDAFPRAALLPVPMSPFSPAAQWLIPQLVVRTRADVYHSPYYIFPYLIPLPIVVTLHDTIPTRFPAYFSPFKRRLIRALKALAIRRAAHLLADSRATARDVVGFYRAAPSRITVAPLAPAPQFRPHDEEEIAIVRARYALPTPYFLFVGSAKPHKNLALLHRVWQRLEARWGPTTPTLVLVGPLRETGGRDPAIPQARYLDFVPEEDLPALYAGAHAFLFPSLYEGFGLPVLEAMACRVPVLCSDIPALAEVTAGACWRLPPQDEEAWLRAVEILWHEDTAREAWAEKALARAAEFSWPKTAALTVKAYHQALTRDHRMQGR